MNIQAISDIGFIPGNAPLKPWLQELDAHLYAGSTTQEEWLKMYELLEQRQNSKTNNDSPLKPLYPT